MNNILQFHFDEESIELQKIAIDLISKFEVTEFLIEERSPSEFRNAKSHINGIGGARLKSNSVQNGFIIGGAESEKLLKSCKEKIRFVSINCNNQVMISLYVNSENIIRGFVFFDVKSIIEYKRNHQISVDERTGEIIFPD